MTATNATKTEERALSDEALDHVVGGAEKVVIIGCTTPWPAGGYPPGTIVWNPWLSPRPMVIR